LRDIEFGLKRSSHT